MPIQLALLAAAQVHPACAATDTACVPPEAPNPWPRLPKANVHAAGACEISTRWSLMTMFPRRVAVDELAATAKLTLAFP
jgi:hypothetical protein